MPRITRRHPAHPGALLPRLHRRRSSPAVPAITRQGGGASVSPDPLASLPSVARIEVLPLRCLVLEDGERVPVDQGDRPRLAYTPHPDRSGVLVLDWKQGGPAYRIPARLFGLIDYLFDWQGDASQVQVNAPYQYLIGAACEGNAVHVFSLTPDGRTVTDTLSLDPAPPVFSWQYDRSLLLFSAYEGTPALLLCLPERLALLLAVWGRTPGGEA